MKSTFAITNCKSSEQLHWYMRYLCWCRDCNTKATKRDKII